jgi:hypothetical protein
MLTAVTPRVIDISHHNVGPLKGGGIVPNRRWLSALKFRGSSARQPALRIVGNIVIC